MAKLILMLNERVIDEYPFRKEGITIGRKEDNHIVIGNRSVSGYHARIDKAGNDFLLTDLQSTNGTFVNNKKIVSHKLTDGDNIGISKHVLLFVTGGKESGEDQDPKGEEEQVNPDKGEERLPVQEKVGVINFIDGSNLEEFELTKKITKIGKAEKSDIRLSGVFVGATAATVSKKPTGYSLAYAGGMAKLKVNGKVVKESVALEDFDTIEIGPYRFQFYVKEAG
jgi:pSer/pThr/pTyr-binding forkhead associated (FHA) protein